MATIHAHLQSRCLIFFQIISLRCGLIRSRQPQRATQIVRAGRGAGFAEPTFVDFVGFIGVDEDIAVFVVGAGFSDTNLLMPAVLAAYVVGLHGKSQILMHPAVFPENSLESQGHRS